MEQLFCEGEHEWLEEPLFKLHDFGTVAVDHCSNCLAVLVTQTVTFEDQIIDLVTVVDNRKEAI